MTDKKTVFVITKKENDLNGIITNIDENNINIVWEDDTEDKLSNEELEALMESDEFDFNEVELEEDVGETPAAATIHTHKAADANNGDADGNPKTRMDWITGILGNLADQDDETLVKIFNDQQAMIGGEAERAGTAKDTDTNRASIAMKPSAAQGKAPVYTESVVKLEKEEMDKIFGETELTEEAKEKLTTLFKALVDLRLTEEKVKLQEEYNKNLTESLDKLTGELVESINDYFNHISEEWLTVNEVAIESTLRTELTKEFLDGFKNLCVEHYVDIPEERVEAYEALLNMNEKTTEDLKKSINENIEKDKIIKNYLKDKIVSEMSVALTLPQREKFKTLTENVEFDNEESYKKKILTIKEGFVDNKNVANSNIITENLNTSNSTPEVTDPMMNAIAKTLSRTLKV